MSADSSPRSPNPTGAATSTGGSVFAKCFPLALLIALAYFAWTSLDDNEVNKIVEELETPNLVIEGTDGSAESDIDELHLSLEPSED